MQIMGDGGHFTLLGTRIKSKNEFLLFGETQVLVLDIIQLTVDDDDAGDKHNGQYKLKDHQRAANAQGRNLVAEISLDHFDGLECRKIKCGITSCEQSGK